MSNENEYAGIDFLLFFCILQLELKKIWINSKCSRHYTKKSLHKKSHYTKLAVAGTVIAILFLNLYWIIPINIITIVFYGVDKSFSKINATLKWNLMRYSENSLLFFGCIGGWMGAIFAQQLFNHKTTKQPFQTNFIFSIAINIALMTFVYFTFGISEFSLVNVDKVKERL